ncbi:MAG: type III PLP-dependent enzyme [Planctomycetota bacterium]
MNERPEADLPSIPGIQLSAAQARELAATHGTPVLLLAPAVIRERYRNIAAALPGVAIHYALKALAHPAVVTALAAEGCDFDLCSNGEVDLVRAAGVDPARCLHTHPIKRRSDIDHTLAYGCRTFVYDNASEIDKFAAYAGDCELLLRLSFRSRDAVVDLSYKFGAAPDAALDLLRRARDAGLRVRGLCFHAGSQNSYPYKYLDAIAFCRQLFNLAALEDIHLDTLDIGGGFPVAYQEQVMPIADFCAPIAAELARHFPDTRLIAEPGRYIAAPAAALITAVQGRSLRGGVMWYYLDDGLYGCYSGKVYDHADYPLLPLQPTEGRNRHLSVVAGPTCDSIDVVYDGIVLPELAVGELLAGPMMGAYTHASASTFNSLPRPPVVVLED